MKVIGLTGGIGSGKTTLLRWFETQNIPCFESDDVAKTLLNSSLKSFVSKAFGNSIYNSSGILDRKKLAARVFNDPKELAKLNAIVHPAVEKAFKDFRQKYKEDSIIIKEAAILFESGGYENCDAIILVIASEESRIQRVVKRDNIKKNDVEARIKLQWSDDKKKLLSDYLIQNEYLETALDQAKKILNSLLNV
jgi:dephospho-CoA kinase|tara:strand:- start:185 stop:766 length:582 start_codon:yes stop_codon:yes gene_type:complete